MSVRDDKYELKEEALKINDKLADILTKELKSTLEQGFTVEDFAYMVMSSCEFVILRSTVKNLIESRKNKE